tara:strand:- start:223 stop:438 length:216 start_codon:yes stop_codon:yes gene_type:complete
MTECNIIEVFHNISTTCSNDLLVAEDECKVFCIIAVMKGIEICATELFNVGLLENLKKLIKFCVYKKYEGH